MITIQILPNISRSKVMFEINVEYKMKNIFPEKIIHGIWCEDYKN